MDQGVRSTLTLLVLALQHYQKIAHLTMLYLLAAQARPFCEAPKHLNHDMMDEATLV